MSEPKVSVVMPVHNTRRFIDQAILSILSQTFTDFEFIILNDSSTDESGEIARAWARQDDRIRVIENENHLGHSATSNLAVSLARSNYVARMDADDVSHPERLSREWQILSQSADIVLAGSLADGIDAEGKQVRPRDRWRIIRRSRFAPFAHGSILFRKQAFDAVGGYKGSAKRVGDQDLYHRMAKKGRTVTLPEVLYHYRYHLENSTLQRPSTSSEPGNGVLSTDSLYAEGAMRLWAGQSPGIREKLRAEDFGWNAEGLRTGVLASWGNVSPASLRVFMRSGVWLRDRFAGIWIKDGRAYDWRCSEPKRSE
jgi:glycosyltransferase involved in cell wall biosynthesis